MKAIFAATLIVASITTCEAQYHVYGDPYGPTPSELEAQRQAYQHTVSRAIEDGLFLDRLDRKLEERNRTLGGVLKPKRKSYSRDDYDDDLGYEDDYGSDDEY